MNFQKIPHTVDISLGEYVLLREVDRIASQNDLGLYPPLTKLAEAAEERMVSFVRRPTGDHDDVCVRLDVWERSKNPVVHPSVAGKGRRDQIRAKSANELGVAWLNRSDENRIPQLHVDQNIEIAKSAPARLQDEVIATCDFVEIEELRQQRIHIGVLERQDAARIARRRLR